MVIFIEKKPIANIIDVNFEGSKFDEIQQEITRTLLKTNTVTFPKKIFLTLRLVCEKLRYKQTEILLLFDKDSLNCLSK